MRYITLSYLNWLQNGELLNLEVQKKCLKYDDLCSKMHLFQALFLDFQIQQLAILKPVEVGRSYIPQKREDPLWSNGQDARLPKGKVGGSNPVLGECF